MAKIKKVNIAVLASGNGTNFQALARAVKTGYVRANLKLLITDKENAYVRKRANKFKVKDVFLDPKKFKSRLDFDKALINILRKEKIGLIALAGYMRVLSRYFVGKYKHKILNIHPALLPSFKGTRAIQRALAYGCRVTGVTVHFVDKQVDHGPIILQEAVAIQEGTTLSSLERKIHALEHKLYPRAIKLFVKNKLKVKGRHVAVR